MRRYEALWRSIVNADEKVVVNCSAGFAPTLIQAVKKEKSRYNRRRQDLDMPGYGKLQVEQERLPDGKIRISFSMLYNGDKL